MERLNPAMAALMLAKKNGTIDEAEFQRQFDLLVDDDVHFRELFVGQVDDVLKTQGVEVELDELAQTVATCWTFA